MLTLMLPPCIGKGIGPALNPLVPLFEFDGEARSGPTCDIGADEFPKPTWICAWPDY